MKKAMILLMIIVLTLSYKVKADTLYDSRWKTYYNDINMTDSLGTNGDTYQYFIPYVTQGNSISTKYIYFSDIQKENGYDYISIPFMATGVMYTIDDNYDSDYEEFECIQWTPNGSGDYTCSQTRFHQSGTAIVPINMKVQFSVTSTTSQAQSPCSITDNKIKCYMMGGVNWNQLIIHYSITSNYSVNIPIKFNFSHVMGFYKDSQQTIIENQNTQNENSQTIINELNQTQTYTEDMNTNMTGVNETVEYSTQEQNLKSQLDLNTSMLDDLYIDSSTSGFIWDLVGGLRNMNPAIITLMSTMLGLGVIRLILNR